MGSVSPLIQILQEGVTNHSVVRDKKGRVYTGFADFRDLLKSHCTFTPMNSNRAVNAAVVQERVQTNLTNWIHNGEYCEFGQVNLLVVQSDPERCFYIMDGQHRVETMKALTTQFPTRECNFQFRAKCVANEQEAAMELHHFQKCYPSDPRSFFPTQAQNRLATDVLLLAKECFSSESLWAKMTLFSRNGKTNDDPARPKLSDNIFFWLLRNSGLLHEPNTTAQRVFDRIQQMNTLMQTLQHANLGVGATATMVLKAKNDLGKCMLGLFREGKLEWSDLEDRLPLRLRADADGDDADEDSDWGADDDDDDAGGGGGGGGSGGLGGGGGGGGKRAAPPSDSGFDELGNEGVGVQAKRVKKET